jgi:hypothetical protein
MRKKENNFAAKKQQHSDYRWIIIITFCSLYQGLSQESHFEHRIETFMQTE